MTYCRHENTLTDLQDVIDNWDNFDPEQASEYELKAREQLEKLINWDEI